MSNIFIGLKNTSLGVLDKRRYEGDGNETSLKEGGEIEIEIYIPYTRCTRSLSLLIYYLPKLLKTGLASSSSNGIN